MSVILALDGQARESRVQGHPRLCSKFEASLVYRDLLFKKEKKGNIRELQSDSVVFFTEYTRSPLPDMCVPYSFTHVT